MKKTALILAACLVVFIGYWVMKPREAIGVHLTRVERGSVEASVANTRAGTIKACQRSRLSMPMGGQVAELHVDEGDVVGPGDILIRLWNEDQAARLEEAGARLREMQAASSESCDTAALDTRELKRQQGLAAKKLISEDRLDAAQTQASVSRAACRRSKAAIATAKAAVKLHKALYEKTLLRAPFAGVVAEINGEVGEYITPSPPGVATPPAVDLIGSGCLYVSAPIDEVDAAAIRLGNPARVTLDAFRGQVFQGTVSRIAPYVREYEKQARTVDIDVTIANAPDNISLLAGYSADIEIILEKRSDVLRLATEAVVEGNRVLRFNPATDQLEPVDFTPGISNWTYTEVGSGLAEDDMILLSLDTEGAEAGARVRPLEAGSDGR